MLWLPERQRDTATKETVKEEIVHITKKPYSSREEVIRDVDECRDSPFPVATKIVIAIKT